MNIDIEPVFDEQSSDNQEQVKELELEMPSSVEVPEDKKNLTETIISLRHADVCQKDILILSDVNLSIHRGELVYIVGKTGSGKSHLLKLLYGEVPPAKGDVEVAGFNMNNINSAKIQLLRRKLGIVFQDFQLLYDRSVYENLKFVTKVTGWKDKNKRDERIMEVLDRVGLKTKGHKMPHQLSGGEQQRVCIARALVNYPEIILADEPTGNLDPETSYDIFKLFKEISEQGTPVLIATHDYLIVEKIPARVLFIEQGKVL